MNERLEQYKQTYSDYDKAILDGKDFSDKDKYQLEKGMFDCKKYISDLDEKLQVSLLQLGSYKKIKQSQTIDQFLSDLCDHEFCIKFKDKIKDKTEKEINNLYKHDSVKIKMRHLYPSGIFDGLNHCIVKENTCKTSLEFQILKHPNIQMNVYGCGNKDIPELLREFGDSIKTLESKLEETSKRDNIIKQLDHLMEMRYSCQPSTIYFNNEYRNLFTELVNLCNIKEYKDTFDLILRELTKLNLDDDEYIFVNLDDELFAHFDSIFHNVLDMYIIENPDISHFSKNSAKLLIYRFIVYLNINVRMDNESIFSDILALNDYQISSYITLKYN